MSEKSSGYMHTNIKGVTYRLHCKDVKLRGGKEQRIYFFAKEDTQAKGTPCELPEDREVVENERNGFLVVKRKK